MQDTPSPNLEKYRTAWSHLCSAKEELESVQVGINKALYKQIDDIIAQIGAAGKALDDQLIRPEEDAK